MPAILNDKTEYNFIMKNQIDLNNNQSYWISGFTRTIGDIDFILYYPYQPLPGEINLFDLCLVIVTFQSI